MCTERSYTGSIQMVRSSLWEKATREFDPHLPEKLLVILLGELVIVMVSGVYTIMAFRPLVPVMHSSIAVLLLS